MYVHTFKEFATGVNVAVTVTVAAVATVAVTVAEVATLDGVVDTAAAVAVFADVVVVEKENISFTCNVEYLLSFVLVVLVQTKKGI